MTDTILFFDTETTGFAQFKKPSSHPSQPHIVQIAASLVTSEQKIISQFSAIVKTPDGVSIPKEASDVHGITDEINEKYGLSPVAIMRLFHKLYSMADLLVAHNVPFDKKVIKAAGHRFLDGEPFDQVETYCTMKAATPIIDLPPTPKMVAAGFTNAKSPKLEECIAHFFDEKLEGAHDAMIDVVACQRTYFHLQSLETEAA